MDRSEYFPPLTFDQEVRRLLLLETAGCLTELHIILVPIFTVYRVPDLASWSLARKAILLSPALLFK
jgi:hypothetical protein